ncbi:MAG: family 43 glycosylhydrolase [Clostridia bacterium]|nr:family 43 glycosylhydrolase [Clostridia bacterium]
MRKVMRFLLTSILFVMLTVTLHAKEVVVYENDFSSDDFSAFTKKGSWQVTDGMLSLGNGSGSAFLTYAIPEEYAGMNFQVDVDFFGHTSTGGILIGGTGDGLAATAPEFLGYDCFIGTNGKKAALGCYNAQGVWSGNIVASSDVVTAKDIHLSVRVVDNELTYTVTSPDGTTQYYGVTYEHGTSTKDVYDAFGGTIGLRKFYSDRGTFDNFRLTVFVDDVLPTMNEKVELDGVSFNAVGLQKSGSAVSGSGAMLTTASMQENFTAEVMLTPVGVSKLFFGMDDSGNGYAFEIHKKDETVALYQIKDGKYICLGRKNAPIGDGSYLASVSVYENVATAIFDTFSQGEDAFFTFELKLKEYTAGKFGVWLEGGKIETLSIMDSQGKTGDTYTNPVNTGADPDVLFYDGTYYLYHRISNGNNIFRVYTSPDLVHWLPRDIVFTHKPGEYTASSYMSPNVFYYDGLFYLFYAAKNASGSNRIFCAYSESPYGPFEHKNGQVPLHNVPEIGGHPYLDESGKVYMSYVRFDNGNHIYLEEVTLKDGVFSAVPGTLRKVVSPTTEYENDGYGNISEGGVLYKHNGYYYMIYASGHYKGHYGEAYAIAENILGPYTKYEYNEILTYNSAINGVGDGVYVKSPDGTELYMVYHKHVSNSIVEPRQTCIDKVQFVKDPNGGPDILTVNGPSTTSQYLPSNIYRYDVNRDGKTNLLDAFYLIKRQATSPEYCGSYDVDANGRENYMDAVAIMKKIAE